MSKRRDTFGDAPLGSGGRFAECVEEMRGKPRVYDPEGLCAYIGRRAYGKKRFQKMSQRGRANPTGEGAATPAVVDGFGRRIRFVARAEGHELYLVKQQLMPAVAYDEDGFRIGQMGDIETGAEHIYAGEEWVDRPGHSGLEEVVLLMLVGTGSVEGAPFGNPRRRYRQGVPSPKVGDRYRLPNGEVIVVEEVYHDREQAWVRAPSWSYNFGFAELRRAELVSPHDPDANPCGAGGYGLAGEAKQIEAVAAANPVKGDGRWHRGVIGEARTYDMRTAKGVATCVPYKPRKYTFSATLAGLYEKQHGREIPVGSKWLCWVRPAHKSLWSKERTAPFEITAHKTLDDAKRAGENALRRLPMPGAQENPAELVGAGILAGSAPIPSGIDSPWVGGGILAGSRPIPSGLRDPRLNAGLVDPPLTRRSKPEQP